LKCKGFLPVYKPKFSRIRAARIRAFEDPKISDFPLPAFSRIAPARSGAAAGDVFIGAA
jgi:hypothetical protein